MSRGVAPSAQQARTQRVDVSPNGFSVNRFSAFTDLSEGEERTLRRLFGPAAQLDAGCDIREAWGRRHTLFLLHEGWAASSADLADGGRQILKIHLPGELIGAPSLAFDVAVETLSTLTPVRASPVSLPALGELFERAPRLAAVLFLSAQEERALLMDRLTAIGRMDAERGITALLLHLHERLLPSHPSGVIPLPLTQLQIADVIGLTPVHVSRVMRRLEKAGRIRRRGRTVELLDPAGLRAAAAIPQRRLRRDPDWLPARG